MILDTKISGIPCQVRVTHFFHQKAIGYWADSPEDCYGYIEVEFDVLDKAGRRAQWLERKMTDADRHAIEEAVIAAKKIEHEQAQEDLAEERYLEVHA